MTREPRAKVRDVRTRRAVNAIALLALGLLSSTVSATCRWQGGSGLDPQCRLEDCPEDGGIAQCTEPKIVPPNGQPPSRADGESFQYHLCDGAFGSVYNQRVWCEAAQGIWGGPTSCEGLPEYVIGGGGTMLKAEGPAMPISQEYVRVWGGACDEPIGSDSGWGAGAVDPWSCWDAIHKVRNGHILDDHKSLEFQFHRATPEPEYACILPYSATVYVRRIRDLACPPGYMRRDKFNGDLQCVMPALDQCPVVGNPVLPGPGAKTQTELDYRSGGIGGLELARHFNSFGFIRTSADEEIAPNASDYWRHTYDRRLHLYADQSFALAAAQRPDGSLKYFDDSGQELHNQDGAAATLSSTLIGQDVRWILTLSDASRETYAADGKLLSIVTRAGLATTLHYSDGRLASVVDQFGKALQFVYQDDRLESVVAPGGAAIHYAYDALGNPVNVVYPGGGIRSYHYEDQRHPYFLTGITDENGDRFATFSYDSVGRASSTEHAGGAERHAFVYNGHYTTVTDSLGAIRHYFYALANGVSKVTSISQPCTACGGANAKATTYDANGNVASRTDFNGNRTNYTYDLSRNLETSRSEALTANGSPTPITRTIATEWHPSYRLPAKITEPSAVAGVDLVTDFVYDGNGNLVGKSLTAGAQSRAWTYGVDAYGRVLSVDGPRSDVSDINTYTYYPDNDACLGCRGQVHTTTNALGHVTTYESYDDDSRVLRFSDANGVATEVTYTQRGWVSSRTSMADSSAAETTALSYDDAGQVVRVTQPDGSFVAYEYDAAHRLTDVMDGLGNVVQYELDSMGHRVSENVFDPNDNLKRARKWAYDSLGRLSKDIGAYGETAQLDYDANGNNIASMNPEGGLTSSAFDQLNRMIAMTDPSGARTQHEYDARGNLVAVTDPMGLTTQYAFDGLGNLSDLSSPDTGMTHYASDVAGNRASQTDARGVTTTYSYDALNRIVRAVHGTGVDAIVVDYTYDQGTHGIGRLASVSTGDTVLSYVYDAAGRVVQKMQAVDGVSLQTSYGYHSGQLKSVDYPSGTTMLYEYDSAGRIARIELDDHESAPQVLLDGVAYQPFGQVDGFTFAMGLSVERKRDLNGRVSTLTSGPGLLSVSEHAAFEYDASSRLTHAAPSGHESISYAYDAVGNRTQAEVSQDVSHYNYDAGTHRLGEVAGTQIRSYAFDAAGNTNVRDATVFSYDARNRLTSISGNVVASYSIDGRGERVRKYVGGTTTYFSYDEQGRILGEYGSSGDPLQEYIYLNELPVAVLRVQGPQGPSILPILADHLGTPRAVVDPDRSMSIWEWPLGGRPFGDHPAIEDPDGDATNFEMNLRFPGQYYDHETGSHYNYFRDYEPTTGRYLQPDPIGQAGGTTLYSYVSNRPLMLIDPFGESAVGAALPWAGGAAVADGPIPIGDLIGGGILLGAIIYDLCDGSEEDECAQEIEDCMRTCQRARRDPNQRGVWGGSWARCLTGCVSFVCQDYIDDSKHGDPGQ